jgi:DNA-binding beta-propeller fold protein YncE
MRKILVFVLGLMLVNCLNAQTVKLIPNPDTSAMGFDGNFVVEFNGALYSTYTNKNGKRQLAKYASGQITLIANPDTVGSVENSQFIVFNNSLYFSYLKNDVYSQNKYEYTNRNYAKFDGSSIQLISNPINCFVPSFTAPEMNFMTIYNSKLYCLFKDTTATNSWRFTLAKTSGTAFSTINTPSNYYLSLVQKLFIFNNKLCIPGYCGSANKTVVFTYDGNNLGISDTSNTANTVLMDDSRDENFTYNNKVFYSGYNYNLEVSGLFQYDGNVVKDAFIDSSTKGNHYIRRRYGLKGAILNNKMVVLKEHDSFSATNNTISLLQFDSTNYSQITNPDSGYGVQLDPTRLYSSLYNFKNKLFFSYLAVNNKYYLANYDGTKINLIPNLDTSHLGVPITISANNKIYFPYYYSYNKWAMGSYNDTSFRMYSVPDTLANLWYSWHIGFDNTLYFLFVNSNGKGQIAYLSDSVLQAPCNPSISISASTNSICYGTKVTFTATTQNAGTAPTYQWKKNNVNVVTNSGVYVDSLLNQNDSLVCLLTNTVCNASANSNVYKVTNSISKFAYIANKDSTISILDLENQIVSDTIKIGKNVTSLAVSPKGDKVILSNNLGGIVKVFNTKTKTVTNTPLYDSIHSNICFDNTGNYFYYCGNASLNKVDANTYSIISQTALGANPFFSNYYSLTMSYDNSEIFLNGTYFGLSVFNSFNLLNKGFYNTNDTSYSFRFGSSVAGNADATKLYSGQIGFASNLSFLGCQISVYDRTTNSIQKRIPVSIYPQITIMDTLHSKLFVSCDSARAIDVINTTTNTVITSIPTNYKPSSIVLSKDGSKLYVSCVGALVIIDANTNLVIQSTPTNKSDLFVGNFIANIDNPCNNSKSIAGNIKTALKKGIKNVNVKLTGNNSSITVNDNLGNYNFTVVDGNYTIRPTKNNDISKANGVTSIDALLTQRHILNIAKLNSSYKIIAADVNGDKAINSVDVLRIKRLILGTDTTFTSSTKGNRLWEFVDSAYVFPDTTNPFPFKDSITVTNLISNKTNQNFIGVKLGDVNYDWNPAVAKGASIDNVELIIDKSQWTIDNGQLKIPIKVKNFKDIAAMQYTLHFDNSKYEFVGIENNKLNIDFNENQANKTGNIAMLWTDKNAEAKTLEDGTELFTLVLKPVNRPLSIDHSNNNGLSSIDYGLALTNNITNIEAWDKDFIQHNIILAKQETTTNNLPLTTIQWSVSPNPTSGEIKVSIISKVNKAVSFELTDAQGKIVFKQVGELKKGNNNFILNFKQNGNISTGIYFLKVVGMEGEYVKRILIK